ncbi:MAG: FIST C-terminal domain-containing protein [Geopsychrobacter sp.]|nr:FIST C-terminal domain-containing protein [Geopsychrobacter sp.]
MEIEHTGQVEALEAICVDFERHADVAGLLILTCDANGYTPELLDPLLTSCCLPLIGAVFPEIIVGNKTLIQGSIVVGLRQRPDIFSIAGLSDQSVDFEEAICSAIPDFCLGQTVLVFVDAFGSRLADLMEGLFNNFGLEVNYLGGGSGSLSFNQKPCVLTNQGMLEDAAVIALLDVASGVGVQHGWSSLAGPYKVTESTGCTIVSIDWQPAYTLYKQVLSEQQGISFAGRDFYAIAQNYPFGLRKLDAEMVVRDPLTVGAAGEMTCVGEVPENSYLDILIGDVDTLVDAASEALRFALHNHTAASETAPLLLFDCVSRSAFMEDEFQRELDVFHGSGRRVIGALTLGEIANCGKSYLELFNKTTVVGVIDL